MTDAPEKIFHTVEHIECVSCAGTGRYDGECRWCKGTGKKPRRMNGYYIGFDATGSFAIDKILGAVACAGKAYHHTNEWGDETPDYDDHTGGTPEMWIQNAATDARAALDAMLAKAREDALRELEGVVRSCIYHDAAGSGFDQDAFESAIEALIDRTASAQGTPDVRVKPLPWEKKGGGLYCWPLGLHYYIEGEPGDYYASCMVYNDDVWEAENSATIEEMKAQCQAHFQTQIQAFIDRTAEGEA